MVKSGILLESRRRKPYRNSIVNSILGFWFFDKIEYLIEYRWDEWLTAVFLQAKSLLEFFPASDKSFSRLLGEVPLLPESALKVLDDLCYSGVIDHQGKVIRDIERVTQGLGAIWSLILGRPQYRQACLDIALKVNYYS